MLLDILFGVLIVTTLLSFAGTLLHTMALNRMIFAFAQQNMTLSTYNAMVAATQGPERASESEGASGSPLAETAGSTPAPVQHIHVFKQWIELPDVTTILPLIGAGEEMFCETCLAPANPPGEV